jgi:hypothetical protein
MPGNRQLSALADSHFHGEWDLTAKHHTENDYEHQPSRNE